MRAINELIIHASATPPSMDIGAKEIKLWHTTHPRNWSDIGYHFVIRRNGMTEDGRPLSRIGAHARGHNEESIGICLVGGLDESHRPDANYTISQYNALADLVRILIDDFPDINKISGHREYSSMKACPCFDVNALLGDML